MLWLDLFPLRLDIIHGDTKCFLKILASLLSLVRSPTRFNNKLLPSHWTYVEGELGTTYAEDKFYQIRLDIYHSENGPLSLPGLGTVHAEG